jgi:flagellar basal body-associated protein FliL
MTTDNNEEDKNESYGKLKWTDLILLIGAIVVATLFILFYFNL